MTVDDTADVMLAWLSSHTNRDVGKCVPLEEFMRQRGAARSTGSGSSPAA